MNDTNSHTPQCIGFIMDGNRRWAKARELDTVEGHKKGSEVFSNTIRWVRDRHIAHAVFYAFSSENWNRSEKEVAALMKLALQYAKAIKKEMSEQTERSVRFRVIGDTSRVGEKLQAVIRDIEEKGRGEADTTIWVAFSYGGRAEIVHAVNKAVEESRPVNEESFKSLMWSNGMPDPDLIVRTGGQQRLSNFLTWQSAYSELLFLEKFWPELTNKDLVSLLQEYIERNRTFGT